MDNLKLLDNDSKASSGAGTLNDGSKTHEDMLTWVTNTYGSEFAEYWRNNGTSDILNIDKAFNAWKESQGKGLATGDGDGGSGNGDGGGSNPQDIATIIAELRNRLDSYSTLHDSQTFVDTLADILQILNKSETLGCLSSTALADLATSIMNNVYNFTLQNYTNDYNLQLWYLQQQYNSPVAQMERLAAAGLNSAYITGSYSSGNAQTTANSASPTGSNLAAVGTTEQTTKSLNLQKDLGYLGVGANLISALGGAGSSIGSLVGSIAQAWQIKQTTPHDIAHMDSSSIMNYVTSSKAFEDASNLAAIRMDDQYNQQVAAAGNEVQLAQNAKDTSALYAFYDQTELKYTCNAFSKSKGLHKVTLSSDEIRQAAQSGWTTSSGEQICDEHGKYLGGHTIGKASFGKSSKHGNTASDDHTQGKTNTMSSNTNFRQGKGINTTDTDTSSDFSTFANGVSDLLGIEYNGSVEQGGNYGNNSRNSKTLSTNKGKSGGSESSTLLSNGLTYDENGNITNGTTTFYQTTTTKKVLRDEYKKEWESRCKRLEDAARNYNSLTTGEKRKLYLELSNAMRDGYRAKNQMMLNGIHSQLQNVIKGSN